MTCVPWTLDQGCCPEWATLDPAVQERSETMAWQTLHLLTGGMVGNCETALRPCIPAPCSMCTTAYMQRWAPVTSPYTGNDAHCGGDGCSCPTLSEIVFPGRVAQVVSVVEDGITLDPVLYRLDGNRLVRLDGGTWPACQDMRLAEDAVGALVVRYIPGVVPGLAGELAAGVLACEFSRACAPTGTGGGSKCRLPSSVVSIARQGVTMQFSQSMYPSGQTGIREVDSYVLTVNPNSLKTPPSVWSPDAVRGRLTGTQVP